MKHEKIRRKYFMELWTKPGLQFLAGAVSATYRCHLRFVSMCKKLSGSPVAASWSG